MGETKGKNRNDKARTLQSMGVQLMVPVFLALLGLIFCLSVDFMETRALASQYAEDTAGLYVERFNLDITQINTELILEAKNNQDIRNIPSEVNSTQAQYYKLFANIKNQNVAWAVRYKEVEKFFVYGEQADVLIGDTGTVFSHSTPVGIMGTIRDFSRIAVKETSDVTKWDFLSADEKTYLIGWYVQDAKVIGCVISLEKIFSMLREMPQRYQVIPFMRTTDGTMIFPQNSKQSDYVQAETTYNSELYEYQLGTLGKLCVYIIPNGGLLERVLKMQVLLVVLIIMLLVLCLLTLYRYYDKVMGPLTQFVMDITKAEEEQMLNENGKNNILELEAASERFRELLRKIRSLKIAIYEKELNEKKAELEYVQEQIRPHFILNCLSLIHGMADAQGDEKIASTVKILSEYIRYNYQDSGKVRDLQKELEHVQTYVEIQKLRYGEEAFGFEVFLDELDGNYQIPPLILQTLVENAIVHAVNLDTRVEISLYMTSETYEDGKYLYISISDTGKGFSKEILEALEKDLPIWYGGRKHVGLQNIKRRLQLLYKGRASMVIQNMDENYGAVVELRIPQEEEL